MRYIVPKRIKSKISVFIIGVLLGSALSMLRIGSNIDRLNQENIELKLKLDGASAELSELKERDSENKGYIVTKVETEVTLLSSNLTPTEIERLKILIMKETAKHYKTLIGSKVSVLNPALLPKLIDGRLFKFENKYFKIFVKSIVLSETIFLTIEAIHQ